MAKENKKELSQEEQFKAELSKQFYDVIKRVIVSEKNTRLAEFENKLVFEIDRAANKPVIKLLIESEFGKKVTKVNTVNSINGKKEAIVTFADEGAASDLSSELGLI